MGGRLAEGEARAPSGPPLIVSFVPAVSYAEAASRGPKQTPQEAAAPPIPEIEHTESIASTTSMPDVDSPDIQTIASEDAESFVHAARSEAEELGRALEQETTKAASAAHRATDQAKKAAGRAQATASSQARALGASVKRADQWLAGQVSAFEAEHPRAAQAVVVSNLLAVVGLGAFLGLRAWGLHDQGRLGGKSVAVGLAVLGAVGAVESAFANYFYKGKGKKQ